MKKMLLSSLLALALQPAIADEAKVTEKAVETAEKAMTMELPAAKRVDENASMEKSMKKMAKNFKKIKKAKDVEAMKEPAEALALYASQSQAIAEEMAGGMKKLRMGIAQLQAAIDKGDEAQARAIFKELNKRREKAHEYFDVDDD